MTKLMPYQFKVEYQPGHANAADFLSRSNPVLLKRNSHKGAEEHICFVAQTSTPHALQYKTFQEHSKSDKLLRALKHSVINNNFSPTGKLSTFYPVRNCLSVQENVILYNNKIIVPHSLRQQVLNLAHEGHQGVVRTKQRLRSKVWWPGMSAEVEKHIQHCHPCQVVGPAQKPTPLQMTPIPKAAWLLVGADLCGPFPTGEHL